MIDINAIVPDGILCLWSAWNIHQLTTSMPQAFHVAIKRDRKVTVPSFPKLELHHFTESILEIGVTSMEIDGFRIKLYDVERCVCDAVKFRNKVGIDVCFEVIGNYLERPDRNLSKLMDYARLLRVGTILEQYLQVKLWVTKRQSITGSPLEANYWTFPKKRMSSIRQSSLVIFKNVCFTECLRQDTEATSILKVVL